MTGTDLLSLIREKWGVSYDVQLRRTQGKIFLQVMWRYQEQVSFPLSEGEYLAHLEDVASYVTALGVESELRQQMQSTRDKPRLGKAVSFPIDLGQRASEWLLE
jgi:hypothetical protein